MPDILANFNQRNYHIDRNKIGGVSLSKISQPNDYLKVERLDDAENEYLGINWSTTMGAMDVLPLLGGYFGDSYRVQPLELSGQLLQVPEQTDEVVEALRRTVRYAVDGGEEPQKDIEYFVWRKTNKPILHQVGALVIGKVVPDDLESVIFYTATTPIANARVELLEQATTALQLNS